jgi:tRNA pseudouridine38-40 synthase
MPTGAGDPMRPSSVTYKSIVAYDGTEFEGFQRQKQGIRTVQASLEAALAELGWRESSIRASGRTDRGVHARGQVISYQLQWKHGQHVLTRALNSHLPRDIAVRETAIAPVDFHPRFSASSRCYRYSCFVDPLRQPLFERYALHLWQAPNVELMRDAARLLIGEHDFRVFGPAPHPEGTTLRTVLHADWSEIKDGWLAFDIEANAFLQHMVRRIVALLLEIGYERVSRRELEMLLEDPGARWQGAMAAPSGLCLESVRYPSSSD